MTRSKQEGGLGFQDLQCFNKALLAKTVWRLMMKTEDYWCRILRGIYFPNGDFLNAKGKKALWGWSSLLEVRDLLKGKYCWKLGNGNRINVWRDRWIWGLEGQKLQGEVLGQDLIRKDAEIIEEGRWVGIEQARRKCFSGREGGNIEDHHS